jgi:hypothetical protein
MPELSTLGSTIKAAYEGQSDTNPFTDTAQARLGVVISSSDLISSAAGNLLASGWKIWVGTSISFAALGASPPGNTIYIRID